MEILALKQKLGSAAFLVGTALLASSCGAAPSNIQAADMDRQSALAAKGNSVDPNETSVSKKFRNLDEYLLHLQNVQGPVDGPWYREIRPGVYKLQTGNLELDETVPGPKLIYTREELERKFGFRK